MSALVTARGLALAKRLAPLDLELRAGELACLIGPNGSGKTSLLHAVAGIGSPSGEVRIDGTDPWRVGPQGLLSYLPATREVSWPMLARDVVALGGASAAEVGEAIALLDLDALAGRRMDRLSTGERSRVLIARALAGRPKLLLLDEPTANLDPLWQLKLMGTLRRLASDGRALLVAMHDLDLAGRFADRLILMDSGRVAADGAPREVLIEVERVFGIRRGPEGWTAAY
ncbi:MAG: ABC transporter ATP-binding protein [Alphaproteobacteria bacterium]|nr:MAG: ABC transporter ATP-binding protein [Alphaproteobacteria bacterium]